MYQSYEFTFAGMPASMYGLFICDLGGKKHGDNAFGNKANIVETRIANRISPIHYGVRYNDEPLMFPLIFGAEKVIDRYQFQEISKWLTGYQEYQWLSIDQPDLEHVQFRCIIQSLTPISVRWLPVAFEAKIICDCPYGYSFPFEKEYSIGGQTRVRFYNDSTTRELLRPQLQISLSPGCDHFSVLNESTGKTMEFRNLPSEGISFIIDNENGVITESLTGYDLYDNFNYVFLELEAGDNALVFEGVGTVKISGRFLYNVGA